MIKQLVLLLMLTTSIDVAATPAIEVYLVRHGETWYNVGIPDSGYPANVYIQGGLADGPVTKLCPEGRKQAQDVGLFLKERFSELPRLYSSCLKRAVETAKIAAKTFGLPIQAAGNSDDELAVEEECLIRKIDLAEIRHGRNDGLTEAKVRTALYQALFDEERVNHPMQSADYDPYWKWKIVPSAEGRNGSFDDAEKPWHLLTRVVNTLMEIGDDHVAKSELGNNVVAVTSSAVIQSLKTSAEWRKYLKECSQNAVEPEPREIPVFCEKSLAKNGGIYHFRYHPEEADFLDKFEFIEELAVTAH